jgi:hypothetical protein
MALIMLQRADSLVLRTVAASRAVVCRAAVATRRSRFSPRPRMAVMTSGSAGTVIVASCWTAVVCRQVVRPCCRVYLLMVDGETPQAAAISISGLPDCISVALQPVLRGGPQGERLLGMAAHDRCSDGGGRGVCRLAEALAGTVVDRGVSATVCWRRGDAPGSRSLRPVGVAFEGRWLGRGVDEAVDHGGGDNVVAEDLAPADPVKLLFIDQGVLSRMPRRPGSHAGR